MAIVKCLFCKNPIYKQPWQLVRNKGNSFCSNECHGAYVKMRKPEGTHQCCNCKRIYHTNPAYSRRMPNQKMFYCSNKCRREYEKNHYKEWIGSDGYIRIGKKRKNRIVMEEKLGRKLTSNEIVHHINGNILDDRPENLQVMTWVEHAKFHQREKQSQGIKI